jgi:hypothetical protein
MNLIKNIPDWLGTAILGAIFTAIGYFIKTLIDWRQAKRKEHAEILSQLLKLQSLLNASHSLFNIQQDLAKKLIKTLALNHKDKFQEKDGYEETITFCYAFMNDGEKVIHGIIRAYSEYSMKFVNQSISDWLKADNYYITGVVEIKEKKELAAKLTALDTHLILWQAKCEYWIQDYPEHALVYLADEKKHGLGFPENLDEFVTKAVEELQRKWK